ncbi:hypothetical protein Tco_1163916 [Tanacetum coccineum]
MASTSWNLVLFKRYPSDSGESRVEPIKVEEKAIEVVVTTEAKISVDFEMLIRVLRFLGEDQKDKSR